ncbi:MAG: hypothetical protein NW200_13250 [Hyphomonadaceae bacterium]|nr:hypothetical protein [Hyphomonadaceae bacterium]
MSLNRTLNRIFDEVRREAKRNPAFADRLEAVILAHASARDVPESVLAEIGRDEQRGPDAAVPEPASQAADLNPIASYTRDGAEALQAALSDLPESALTHLVSEHNLDPAGVAAGLPKSALIAHIVAQAARRIERDRKLFDY